MPLRGGKITFPSIYISLNARAEPGTFHWGLVMMDSETQGTFHHATNPSGGWKYEMRSAIPEQDLTLVAMVRVSDLKGTVKAAMDVIKSVPADGSPSKRTGDPFNCATWLKDVLVALDEAGCIQLPMTMDQLARVANMKSCGALHLEEAERGHGAYIENDPELDDDA